MNNRERFITALERKPITGLVPTFELVFYLTMESLRKVHPTARAFHQWNQMTDQERQMQREDIADTYIETAKKYHHSAIFVHPNPYSFDEIVRLLTIIREKTGDEYYLTMHGDPTFAIPNGDDMLDFTAQIYEEPEKLHEISKKKTEEHMEFAEKIAKIGGLLDGFTLCSDYCFNVNPFFSPSMFEDLIAPYLEKICTEYRNMGFYTIKHTDGNIMPIMDQIVQCKPDAVHSLDPQGGVDMSVVKKMYGDRVCLVGNVNCGLLQTGTDEEVVADVRRSLKQGMDGFGYIFSTSNCAFTGLALDRYELMNKIWFEEGRYI